MKQTTNNIICSIISIFVLTIHLAQAQTDVATKNTPIYKDFKTEHVWDAKVTIASGINLGNTKYGSRNIIPITGGTFEGPNIKGEVLPYGADWQLVRPDGDVEFNARYLLKTDDGHVIQVINKVLFHMGTAGQREMYTKSVIDLEAPNNSPYAYLNHAIFLGTLTMPQLKPGETPYVIIGVYKVL